MIETSRSLPPVVENDILSEGEHLQKARLNISFLKEITKTSHNDWTVIVCFYIQMHYACAFLKRMGYQIPANHDGRQRLMNEIAAGTRKGCTQVKAILAIYTAARTWSEMARYKYPIDIGNHKAFKGTRMLFTMIDNTLNEVPKQLNYSPESF